MPTMNISLPDPMKRYVEERVASGTYSSVSEYVRELVRADQKRQQTRSKLEDALLEGLASGPGEGATPEFWARVQEDVSRRVAEGRTSPPDTFD